jgi:predicted transcriptional regulator
MKCDMAYLFSIRPEYCERIYDGVKTVELRRRVSPKIAIGSLMLIYETTPTKAVTGTAVISDIKSMPINALWAVAEMKGGIDQAAFFSYFAGLESGYVIQLRRATRLPVSVPLTELVGDYGLQAPQSYREINDRVAAALLGHGQIPTGHQYSDTGGGRAENARVLRLAAA